MRQEQRQRAAADADAQRARAARTRTLAAAAALVGRRRGQAALSQLRRPAADHRGRCALQQRVNSDYTQSGEQGGVSAAYPSVTQ